MKKLNKVWNKKIWITSAVVLISFIVPASVVACSSTTTNDSKSENSTSGENTNIITQALKSYKSGMSWKADSGAKNISASDITVQNLGQYINLPNETIDGVKITMQIALAKNADSTNTVGVIKVILTGTIDGQKSETLNVWFSGFGPVHSSSSSGNINKFNGHHVGDNEMNGNGNSF